MFIGGFVSTPFAMQVAKDTPRGRSNSMDREFIFSIEKHANCGTYLPSRRFQLVNVNVWFGRNLYHGAFHSASPK